MKGCGILKSNYDKKYQNKLNNLTLMSDWVSRRLFEKRYDALSCILSVIFNCNVEVNEIEIQSDFNYRPHTKAATMDIVTHSNELSVNVEIQQGLNRKAIKEKAKFNYCVGKVKYTYNDEYLGLRNQNQIHVLYLVKGDVYQSDEQITILSLTRGIHHDINKIDEDSIIFFDVTKQDLNTDKGRLAFDLMCSDPEKMHFQPLKELMMFLKTRKGETFMCEILDEIIKQEREEAVIEGREEGRLQGIEEGRTQGIEEGRTQGIEEGRTQGIKEGRIQGREAVKLEVLQSLLLNNIRSFAVIKNVTKLTQDEIYNIANTMNIQLID